MPTFQTTVFIRLGSTTIREEMWLRFLSYQRSDLGLQFRASMVTLPHKNSLGIQEASGLPFCHLLYGVSVLIT